MVPCYNEAERWNEEYWSSMLNDEQFQWIFVNDGSSDHTSTLLKKYLKYKNTTVLDLKVNSGKAEAVRQGMILALDKSRQCGTHYIGFIDADYSIEKQDLSKLVDVTTAPRNESFDSFWASRVALAGRTINRRYSRHYISRIILTLIGLFYRDLPYDSQCGLKIFKISQNLADVLTSNFKTRWFFEIELLIRFKKISKDGLKIWEEPLYSWTDTPGSRIKNLEILRILIEILIVIVLTQKSRKKGGYER